MIDKLAKLFFQKLVRNREFYYDKLKNVVKNTTGKKILEFGSGKIVNGKYLYSARSLFPDHCEFICSDLNPEYGHRVIDIVSFSDKNEYDIILCLNVLEHVFDYELAVENLYNALKGNGVAYVAVPMHFPLHDEPFDYWRFTEHSLRIIFQKFKSINIQYNGLRKFPFGYFIEVFK